MSAEQKRAAVAALYSGYAWKERVSRMPDCQIHAIYVSRILGRPITAGGC
jgi:hypothetical protein